MDTSQGAAAPGEYLVSMAFIYYRPKEQVFRPPFSLMLADLEEICQGSVVPRNILVSNFTPIDAWAAPVQTIRTSFFVTKYHNCSCIQRIYTRCRWQTGKCLGSRVCCRETFYEVSNVGGARTKKTGAFPLSCAQPTGKVFLQTDGLMGEF